METRNQLYFKEDSKMSYVKFNAIGIGRSAFAAALGLSIGKCVGDFAVIMIKGETVKLSKTLAKDGNKAAQRVCEHLGIECYDKSEIKSKRIIGFHA